MKKIFFLICSCVVLAIPCFATDDSYFTEQLQVVVGGSDSYIFDTSEGKVYFFGLAQSANSIQIQGIGQGSLNKASISGAQNATFTLNVQIGTTDYYRRALNTFTTSDTYIPNIDIFPIGTSYDDIISAFEEYLGSISIVSNEVTFTLPRGNVLYFKVAENQNVHFTSDFMSNSALLSSGTYGPWGDTQQRFGSVASLPTNSTVFPLSTQNPITWYKSPNQNILGQTKTGATSVSCVTGQYYCFYNPAFSYVSDTLERDAVGGTVHVNGKFSEIKIYPLSQQLTIENGQILMPSDSNDGYASFFDGNANENGTVTFTDQDGNIGMPVNGGQNQQDAPITAQGLIESIRGTLQKILKEIESLFTFGYEAIQSLVRTISDFTSVFAQLYTWLPSPVYQALISAIIIAITIGVFKVFL